MNRKHQSLFAYIFIIAGIISIVVGTYVFLLDLPVQFTSSYGEEEYIDWSFYGISFALCAGIPFICAGTLGLLDLKRKDKKES
jgi:hypothetical protein